jgi:hypothetical protein
MKRNKRIILTFCILGLFMTLIFQPVTAKSEEKEIDLEEITKDYLKFLGDHPKLTLDPGLYDGYFDQFYYMTLTMIEDSCEIWGCNGFGIFRGALRAFTWLFIPMRLGVWAYWLDGVELVPELSEDELRFLGPIFGFIFCFICATVSLSLLVPMGLLGVRGIHFELVVDIFNWCDKCIS